MKVAVVSHGVSDQALLGGPGRVASMHARALAERGHQVRVLTTDLVFRGTRERHPTFDFADRPGIEVRVVPAFTLPWWPGSVGPIFNPKKGGMAAEVVSWADVVHGHEWPVTLVQAARQSAHRLGKPVIIQPHGSLQPRQGARRWLHGGFNTFYRLAAGGDFIAGSDREEEEIGSLVGPAATLYRLANPMPLSTLSGDDPAVRQRRESWSCPPGSVVLLYGHRVVPTKGLDLAIQALSLLPEEYCLVVIGQTTDVAFANHCKAMAGELGVADRIRFCDPVPTACIDEIVLAADVFLLPARRDTFPLMVLHALACGRPVVATSTCQSVEMLAGAVEVAEPRADALARAIANLEPGHVGWLVDRGRRLMREEYSFSAIAGELERIYLRLLDPGRVGFPGRP